MKHSSFAIRKIKALKAETSQFMRLYHFTTLEYGLLAIKNQRLKIARISQLNDPFEFLGWKLKDPEIRGKLSRWKAERDREFGILSFSRKWSHPLLWGHYADKHRGLALGFDVPEHDLFRPVRYLRSRLAPPSNQVLNEAHLDELLLTKFSSWRYESEYRCFCDLKTSVSEGDLFFEKFSDTFRLAEVIVGDRAAITREELRNALGDQSTHVTSFKARAAFGSFTVVRNRKAALWK